MNDQVIAQQVPPPIDVALHAYIDHRKRLMEEPFGGDPLGEVRLVVEPEILGMASH